MPEPVPPQPAAPPWRRRGRVVLMICVVCLAAMVGLMLLTPSGQPLYRSLYRLVAFLPLMLAFVFIGLWAKPRLEARRQSGDGGYAQALWGGVIPAVMFVIMYSIFEGSVLIGIVRHWWMPVFTLALGLVMAGRARRVGLQRFCVKCEYPYIEPTEDEPSPIRCPECGRGWFGEGGTVIGRRHRRPVMIWAGAVMLTIATVGLVAPLAANSYLRRHTPTALLARQAAVGGRSSWSAWKELSTRTLDAARIRTLATAVLDARLEGKEYNHYEADLWLDAQLLAGALPTDLAERFYTDTFSPRLFSTNNARVGEPLIVRLAAPGMSPSFGVPLPRLHLLGFFIAADPEPSEDRGRTGATLYPYQINYRRHPDEDPQDRNLLEAPSVTITPDRPGPLRVRARGWVYYGPWTYNVPTTVTLGPDGENVFPPGTVWSRELDLETTIDISP